MLVNGEYRAELSGIDHWYRIAGAAHATVPLVVIHGGPGGNTHNFERTIGPKLEAFSTVVYYDQRGCGRSASPSDPNAYSTELLIRDLEELRKALGVEKIAPLGFSFGGELALRYALSYHQRVFRVIAQSPGTGQPERSTLIQLCGFLHVARGDDRRRIQEIIHSPHDPDRMLQQVWHTVDRATVDRLLFRNPDAARLNRQLWEESGLQNTGEMARALARQSPAETLYDRAQEIKVQTLIIVGLYDRNSGVDANRDLADRIPDARLVVFEQSAHFPEIEEPERYAMVIREFVES